ncbi:MAG: ArnT family glycosyltransferase [Acidithiobacillales bacterium]
MGLLLAGLRLHTYDEPFDRDLMTYSVMAHELLDGKKLYVEVWDHKPPGIYLSYAASQLAGGYGPLSIYLLGVTAAVGTLVAVFGAVRRATGSLRAGIWAGAFWVAVSSDLFLEANQPNTEALINFCLAGVAACLIPAPDEGAASLSRCIAAGLFLSYATLLKQPAIVAVAPLLLVSFWPFGRERPAAAKHLLGAAVLTGTVLTTWCLVLGWYQVTGRFAAFYETVFEFNWYYVNYTGGLPANLAQGLSIGHLVPRETRFLWPLVILAFAGLLLGGRRRPALGLALLGWIGGTAAFIALPGRFFPHYYQLWLPPLTIGAGCSVGFISRFPERWARAAAHGAALASLALLAAYETPFFGMTAEAWSRLKFGDRFAAVRAEAGTIERLLAPDERFFAWDTEPGLYFYSRRRPASSFTNVSAFLYYKPFAVRFEARLLDELRRAPPELIVRRVDLTLPPDLKDLIDSGWERWPVPKAQEFDYELEYRVRRGGRLEARLSKR